MTLPKDWLPWVKRTNSCVRSWVSKKGLHLLATCLLSFSRPTMTKELSAVAFRSLYLRILVGEGAITAMALVVHELATNSIKYGALSTEAGSLDVTCTANDSEMVLVWTERGGPRISAPREQTGFGSVLVKKTITRNLGGTIAFDWPPEGVIVTLRMNSARLGT